jgi:hypothetical protein
MPGKFLLNGQRSRMDQREMTKLKLVNDQEFGMIKENLLGIEQEIKKQTHLENLVDKCDWTE